MRTLGSTRIVLYGPTGMGKSEVAIGITRNEIEQGRKVLFIADLISISSQSEKRFQDAGLTTGILRGEENRVEGDVVITSPQTIKARLKREDPVMTRMIEETSLFIIDECHTRYDYLEQIILQMKPRQWAVGLSATPMVRDLGTVWQDMVVSTTTYELFQSGYLIKFRMRQPKVVGATVDMEGVKTSRRNGFKEYNDGETEERVIKIETKLLPEYRKMLEDRFPTAKECPRTLIYCPRVDYAHHLAQLYSSMGMGLFVAMDGGQTKRHRADMIDKFNKGVIKGLVSVGTIGKGFDSPAAQVLVDLRPNADITPYLQKIGRVLRPSPEKDFVIILDHAQNWGRFKDLAIEIFRTGPPPLDRGRKKMRPVWKMDDENNMYLGETDTAPGEDGELVDTEIDYEANEPQPLDDPWYDLCWICDHSKKEGWKSIFEGMGCFEIQGTDRQIP